MYVDISLVPFHYTYQWALSLHVSLSVSLSSNVRRMKNLSTNRCSPSCWPHKGSSSSSGNLLFGPALKQQRVLSTRPRKLFNIRSVSCGAEVVSQADGACSHLITAILCHSASLSFPLLLSPPIRVYQNTPGCFITGLLVGLIHAGVPIIGPESDCAASDSRENGHRDRRRWALKARVA